MEIVKKYRDNDILRASFNQLAEDTFGLNFESWYQNGFWKDKYIPYSMLENHQVVANVSVNLMDMYQDGEIKHFIQLGTVMTKPEYRGQGLIRRLMEAVRADYEGKVDGTFLFANDSVLDFYPKFGFVKAEEYQYTKTIENDWDATFQQIPMKTPDDWKRLVKAFGTNKFHSRLDMADNSDLILFYATMFMQENVYYDCHRQIYAIAEIEDDSLFLHAVFAEHTVDLEEVIAGFGKNIRKVTLGFTPVCASGYQCTRLQEEDTTLFMKGITFGNEKLSYPSLSHA